MMKMFIVEAFFFDYDGNHTTYYKKAISEKEAQSIANQYLNAYIDVSVSIYEIKREVPIVLFNEA